MGGENSTVLIVGGARSGCAGRRFGWRRRFACLLSRSDGSIYQPRMDMVGVRTMEFCRRWGWWARSKARPTRAIIPGQHLSDEPDR